MLSIATNSRLSLFPPILTTAQANRLADGSWTEFTVLLYLNEKGLEGGEAVSFSDALLAPLVQCGSPVVMCAHVHMCRLGFAICGSVWLVGSVRTPSKPVGVSCLICQLDCVLGALLRLFCDLLRCAPSAGETLFYSGHGPRAPELFRWQPRAGAALLHAHGDRCLTHEGAEVRGGTKYLLRTDLAYA